MDGWDDEGVPISVGRWGRGWDVVGWMDWSEFNKVNSFPFQVLG